MPGDRQGSEGNGGTIHRQQSNWVEEVTSPSGEASDLIEDALDQAEDLSADDLPSLSSSFSAIESHVTSLESAMDPRLRRQSGDGELGEAYGHQAYESLGPMLRQVQTASSALAERVQALHGRNGLPRDMVERSSRLESRVERAYLAHRARCPPQELERRLSRQASYPPVSSASAAGVAATANTTNFNATTTATATNTAAAAAAATATSPNTATTTTATTTTTGAAATATAVDTAATTVTAATGGESGGFTPTADRFEEVAGTTTPFARTLTLEELVMESAEDEHQQNHEEEVKEAKEEEGKEEKDGEEEQKLAEKRRRREAPEAPLVPGCGDGAAQLLGGAGVSENVSNCGSLWSSAQGAGMEACDEGGERACVDEGPIKPRNGDEEGDAQTMALDAARMAAEKRAVQVYSFGRGDLGTLLQSDDSDHSPEDGPVDLQENGSVIQVSTALFHTVAVMSSNHVIGCGQNDEGQIRPDLHQETFLPRPSLVGPFLSQRVTQVACGLYHTACVTTAGQAFSWGGNESGQLGHSPGVARAALPTAIEVEEAGQAPFSKREVSMVTCGDLFTLILTSRAEVMTCGIGDCVGGDGTDRNKAALVQSLVGFPAVWMACGNSHSVVIGANGGVMAFGLNTHGQLGVGPMAEGEDRTVLQPRPVVGTFSRPITSSPASDKAGEGSTPRGSAPPASAAAAAAAVGGDGGGGGGGGGVGGGGGGAQQVLVASFFAIRAACGQNHTILVSTDGHAWVCGRNRSGQLGLDPDEVPETSSPIRVPLFPLAGDSSGTGRASSRDGGGDGDSNGNGTGSGKENGNGITATVAAAAAVTTAESAGMSYVVQAAAGRAHTLLLLSDGRLLGCGSNEFGALGVSPPPRTGPATAAIGAVGGAGGVSSGDGGSDDSGGRSGEVGGAEVVGTAGGGGSGEAVADAGATHSWHWKPREIAGLTGRWVGSVSAGGEQSFAIVVRSEPSLPTPAHVPTPSLTPMPSSPTPSRSPADGLPAGLSTRPEEEVPSRATAAAAAEVEAGREPGCGEETMLDLFATLAGKSRFEAMRFRLPPRLTFETSESLLSRCGSVTVMAMLEKPGHRSRAGGLEGQGVGNRSWRLEETLVETVKKVFVSPSVLSGSFNLDPMVTGYTSVDKYGCNGPADATTATAATPAAPGWRGERGIPGLTRVDSAGLEAVYTKLVGMGPNMVSALWSAIEKGMETVTGAESGTAPSYSSLSASSPPPSSPPPLEDAGVSCLLKYWQGAAMLPVETPPDSDPNKGPKGRVMSRICMAVVALKAPALWRLMRSAKEDYPPALFSSRLVKPMVAHLGTCLPLHLDKGGGYSDTARLLKWLHSINELDPPPKIPYQDFFSEAISSITVESLLHDLYKWKNETPEGRKKRFYLSEQAFLMPTGAKKALLQAEAAVEQRKAAGASGVRFIPGVGLVLHPFLVLQINRDNLLQETLAQVSQVPDINLRKKLKVVFRGEEGVDEGGVTKEFFQLLTVQLFDQSFGMFVPAGVEGRSLWFNKDCVWAAEEYGLVGLLVGLAVYSGVILDVPLPLVVFKKVLGQQLTVDDLGDVDPDLLQGFQKLRDYAGGDDEDVFGIDFRVTWDDLGMQRTHDLKKNGANIPVTASNKNEYVERYANFLLVESVSHQFTHFKQGFMRVMSGASSISLLRAEELDVLVTGTPELDFDELAQATQYDGGYRGDHPTIKAFWAAVRDMPPEEQRRLLMFVTGSKKAPLGGLGKLSFKIQRAGPDTDHLPTSHTCFNVLMLPEYAGEEKLARLLKRAITECEGFGLK